MASGFCDGLGDSLFGHCLARWSESEGMGRLLERYPVREAILWAWYTASAEEGPPFSVMRGMRGPRQATMFD
jgi:hypothetical protein